MGLLFAHIIRILAGSHLPLFLCVFLTLYLVWSHLSLLAHCPEGLRETLTWSTWQTAGFLNRDAHLRREVFYCQLEPQRVSTDVPSHHLGSVCLHVRQCHGRALVVFRILAMSPILIALPMVRNGALSEFTAGTTSQNLARCRRVLKLRLGSSWLQIQVTARPRISGLSVD